MNYVDFDALVNKLIEIYLLRFNLSPIPKLFPTKVLLQCHALLTKLFTLTNFVSFFSNLYLHPQIYWVGFKTQAKNGEKRTMKTKFK